MYARITVSLKSDLKPVQKSDAVKISCQLLHNKFYVKERLLLFNLNFLICCPLWNTIKRGITVASF